jgi:hypothetical protein
VTALLGAFLSADSKGVTGGFLGSADSVGFSFDFWVGRGVCRCEVRNGVRNFSHWWEFTIVSAMTRER